MNQPISLAAHIRVQSSASMSFHRKTCTPATSAVVPMTTKRYAPRRWPFRYFPVIMRYRRPRRMTSSLYDFRFTNNGSISCFFSRYWQCKFSVSMTFWPLLVAIQGHNDRWMRPPASDFLLVFYSSHVFKNHRF